MVYPWTYENVKSYYDDNLKKFLEPRPFPAKNKGNAISPPSLADVMENAAVSVTFKLNFYKINDKIIYNANVENMIILDTQTN